MKAEELHGMISLQRSLEGLLRFFQFLFDLFSSLLIISRAKLPADLGFLDFLQDGVIKTGLPYLGGFVVVAYVIFSIILFGQRGRIKRLRSEIGTAEHGRIFT
jgi:hypothetical protein